MSKAQEEIALLLREINELSIDIELCDEDIDRIKKSLLERNIPESEILEFIDAENVVSDPDVSDLDKVSDQDTITTLIQAYPDLYELVDPIQQRGGQYWDYKYKVEKVKALQASEQSTQPKQEEQPAETAKQDGHLYPVELVSGWTNKLKQYNKQMDDFLEEIDNMSIQVDITWLCQKIEAFCRRINYALALVRYQIIKTLSRVFKQANQFQTFIDPIANFNPADIFSCLGWVKNVISFFLQPYMTVIQFISDFMTYTPPLVAEAGKLVGKAATVPIKLISKIDIVAESKSGEKKEIAEVFKEYVDIQFQPVTLGEVMGSEPERPTPQSSAMKEKQKTLYEQKRDNYYAELNNIWQKMIDEIKATKSYRDMWVAWPTRRTSYTEQVKWYSNKRDAITTNPVIDCDSAYTSACKIFGSKSVNTKGYLNRKINTNRNQVFGMYNIDLLKQVLENGDLSIIVYGYYTLFHNGATGVGDKATMEARRMYVDYLKTYATEFPCINTYLAQYSDTVKAAQDTLKKVAELDQPTVFD